MNRQTQDYLKIDEKHHVEEPFLQQSEQLGWTVKRLEQMQLPQDSEREHFVHVVILPDLHRGL